MTDPIPGVDYDIAVCDACGKDKHTKAELLACIASIVGPPLCRCCGWREARHNRLYCRECG